VEIASRLVPSEGAVRIITSIPGISQTTAEVIVAETGADLARLAKLTEGYSGADIAHVCETAAEHALLDSVREGTARLIRQSDLEAAIAEVRPSLGPWFETARNVALFANEGGTYDDLAAYLRKRRML